MRVDMVAIREAHVKLSNSGRWGKDDQIGTLNNITADDVVQAGQLIKKGRVFSLGLPLKGADTVWLVWRANGTSSGPTHREPVIPVDVAHRLLPPDPRSEQ